MSELSFSTVLLLEKISTSAIQLFQKAGYRVECAEKLSESELLEAVQSVDALGIRSKTQITPKILEAASTTGRLSTVGLFCIGTDQIDYEYAATKGIAVFNSPFSNTRSVAELVLGEVIMLARQVFPKDKECHQGQWSKTATNCFEVRNKVLAIIGYGNVGQQLSVLAEGLGLRVQFYDIVPKLSLGLAVSKPTLKEAIQDADFVSIHVPGTESTNNLFDTQELEWMKQGSYLLNASRGSVVNLEAVKKSIFDGKILGGAFDVFPEEPASTADPFVCPLQGLSNVILTPHIGGSTSEAQENIGLDVAKKMIDYLKNGSTIGSVNLPQLYLKNEEKVESNKVVQRITYIHDNKPGVLRDINNLLSGYNIKAQILSTRNNIGYLIIDAEHTVGSEIQEKINNLSSTIKTRII